MCVFGAVKHEKKTKAKVDNDCGEWEKNDDGTVKDQFGVGRERSKFCTHFLLLLASGVEIGVLTANAAAPLAGLTD